MALFSPQKYTNQLGISRYYCLSDFVRIGKIFSLSLTSQPLTCQQQAEIFFITDIKWIYNCSNLPSLSSILFSVVWSLNMIQQKFLTFTPLSFISGCFCIGISMGLWIRVAYIGEWNHLITPRSSEPQLPKITLPPSLQEKLIQDDLTIQALEKK